MLATMLDEARPREKSRCEPFSQKPQNDWKDSQVSSVQEWLRDPAEHEIPAERIRKVALVYSQARAASPRATRPKDEDPLASIEEAISQSESLLELEADWDDEGAAAIRESTWISATSLLRRTATQIYRHSGAVLPAPTIGPCHDGSIDLYWKSEKFTLLINCKPSGRADFYGESPAGFVVKGPFEISKNLISILQPLVQ